MPDIVGAVHTALVKRISNDAYVAEIVPVANILDRSGVPELDVSIILGEHQLVDRGSSNSIARELVHVISRVHVWKKEPQLAGVRNICDKIYAAIGRVAPLDLSTSGLRCVETTVAGEQLMRDPFGVYAHGVVTVRSLVWAAG